jgi:hypothetical protein
MRSAVVNGYRWHVVAAEFAELVRAVGPRIALVGGAFFVLIAVPLVLRFWVYFPRTAL